MKFKKLTAVLLSAVTLASAPSLPMIRETVHHSAIIAEAADTIIARFPQNGLSYQAYKDSSGATYAAVTDYSADLTSATVPATVTYNSKTYPVKRIKAYAFWGSKIKTVSFSSSDLTIESTAFAYTSQLTTVTANTSVKNLTINEKAFYQSGIQNFNCYAKNCDIYGNAFADSKLNLFQFRSNVQTANLFNSAFAETKKLTKVKFDNSGIKLTLGNKAFERSSIRDLSIPSSVTTIPESCFNECTNLVNLSLPDTLTTIKRYAFQNAVLPDKMYFPAKTTDISYCAFNGVRNVSAYYVDSANTKYQSIDGVLYTKDGSALCAYPAKKNGSYFESDVKSIWYGAITNNPYLKTLKLQNFSLTRPDDTNFGNNSNLETVVIKSTESNKTGQEILNLYGSFCIGSKVKTINGFSFLKNTSAGQEPKFEDKFESRILENFENYSDYSFMKDYIDKMATYVVNKETNSSMTKLQKAVRLQQWICDRVFYDPVVGKINILKRKNQPIPSNLSETDKNHVDASVFLHKKSDGKYYTVCDGYARAYKILMDKAGIPTDYVMGYNRTTGVLEHAWNLVNLDGTWYHVDVTNDDNNGSLFYEQYSDNMVPDSAVYPFKTYGGRYKYFLCSDADFAANDVHYHYEWESREHPELNSRNGAALDSSLAMRGDLNGNRQFYDDPNNGMTDLEILQQYLLGNYSLNYETWKKADIDKDGKVNSYDLVLLRQFRNQFDLYSPATARYILLEY